MSTEIIHRGGADDERLYLRDLEFDLTTGEHVVVRATDIPNCNMPDLVARNLGRNYPVALYARPGQRVLDFPCGSGYLVEVLSRFGVSYEGYDRDPITIEYARCMYCLLSWASFGVGDLCRPEFLMDKEPFDTIACIEGLEHIGRASQFQLLATLRKALKPGGTLIVSSPENPTGMSGPSEKNSWHLWELNREDFLELLHESFEPHQVEVLTYKAVLHTGAPSTMFFGVCHNW